MPFVQQCEPTAADNMYIDIRILFMGVALTVVLLFIATYYLAAQRKRKEIKKTHLKACHLSKQVLESRRRALDKEKQLERERLITNDKPPDSILDGLHQK